jgi:hypothetical protein
MGRFGHADYIERCPVLGVRRKTSARREYFAFDRLSKKSFCIAYHKFSEPQVQRSYKRGDFGNCPGGISMNNRGVIRLSAGN